MAASDFDPDVAAGLGFPKLKYAIVERERRWLCRAVPRDLIKSAEAITDLYVDGTRLRLREARPLDGGAGMLRLTRKADAGATTRLITSIYLPEAEFAALAGMLRGRTIRKLRHRLIAPAGVEMCVDEFQDALAGLILAEAEFDTDADLAAFDPPDFALREVTGDIGFTGGWLAMNGMPGAEGPLVT